MRPEHAAWPRPPGCGRVFRDNATPRTDLPHVRRPLRPRRRVRAVQVLQRGLPRALLTTSASWRIEESSGSDGRAFHVSVSEIDAFVRVSPVTILHCHMHEEHLPRCVQHHRIQCQSGLRVCWAMTRSEYGALLRTSPGLTEGSMRCSLALLSILEGQGGPSSRCRCAVPLEEFVAASYLRWNAASHARPKRIAEAHSCPKPFPGLPLSTRAEGSESRVGGQRAVACPVAAELQLSELLY